MKKVFIFFLFLLSVTISAQNKRIMVNGQVADTLKSTRKIYNIIPDYYVGFNFTVWTRTLSGIDTLYVSTSPRDTSVTSSKIFIDLSTGSPVSYIIATTIPKEYLIYDPTVYKIRLETIRGLVTTLFKVSRK